MDIAKQLRDFRESKRLSQGDIEKRTGLLRFYVSRVENGHTVPSLETLERLARALEVPLYQLFYGSEDSTALELPLNGTVDWASKGKGLRLFNKFRSILPLLTEDQRELLLFTAAKMVSRKRRGT